MDSRQLELFTEYRNIPWAGRAPRELTRAFAKFSFDARARAGRTRTPLVRTKEGQLQLVLPLFKEVTRAPWKF